MNRRNFIQKTALATSAFVLNQRLVAQTTDKPIIIDGMGEVRLEYSESLISEMIASGINAVQITLGNPALQGASAWQDVLDEIAAYEAHIRLRKKQFLKATTAADIDRAKKEKRIALFYLFQNTSPIGDDLGGLKFFYDLGVRTIQLTYNFRNLVGDGCLERTEAGLSNFGLRVIERMNALGLLIDLSHAGMKTMAEAIHFSKGPVAITHSGCKAVFDHPRNVSDENLRALGEKGGVIGIYQINPYISAKERSTLDDYMNHIDHAVKTAGVESVGIGSDREHKTIPDTEEEKRKLEQELSRLKPNKKASFRWPFFISELNGPRRMEAIWGALGKRGYSSGDRDKVMGGNFYRLIKEVMG